VCRCGGIEPLLLQLPCRGVLTTRLPTALFRDESHDDNWHIHIHIYPIL